METIAPTPKDVVIVIERSNAMQYDSSVGVKTLIEVATEAASGVLDTLNLNDRVSLFVCQMITGLHTPNPKENHLAQTKSDQDRD